MTEKRAKMGECPYCGGQSVITYESTEVITYLCGECRAGWKSYKRKKHDDLLPGQPLRDHKVKLPEGKHS